MSLDEVRQHVDKVAEAVIEDVLGKEEYNADKAIEWTNNISNLVVEKLKEKEGFKFFVTTILFSKGDSGLTMAGACLWNSEKDGSAVLKKDINDMNAIVNVFFSTIDN